MLKKALIINDIPGSGKVASNISFPILNVCQYETSVLPTMILSSQTGPFYTPPVQMEMEDKFIEFISHWQENQLNFDLMLTGYFSTPQQIDLTAKYFNSQKEKYPHNILIVDPVMADNGDFYPGFDHTFVEAYHGLLKSAHIITPNLTEACFLTGRTFTNHLGQEDYEEIASALVDLGVKHVVITSVYSQTEPKEIGFYYYHKNLDQGIFIGHKYFDQYFFGTGDLTVSLITGLYGYGLDMESVLIKTGNIIEKVLEYTVKQDRMTKQGLLFEPFLGQIYHEIEELRDGK